MPPYNKNNTNHDTSDQDSNVIGPWDTNFVDDLSANESTNNKYIDKSIRLVIAGSLFAALASVDADATDKSISELDIFSPRSKQKFISVEHQTPQIFNPENMDNFRILVSEYDRLDTLSNTDSVDISLVQKISNPAIRDLYARLHEYLNLTDDWDGYGAIPPLRNAVQDAVNFFIARPQGIPLPSPQIASDGEVGFYWRTEKVHAEVGFYGDRELSYYARYIQSPVKQIERGEGSYRFIDEGWPEDLLFILRKLT